MPSEEFLKHVCPVVKTLEQYQGLVEYLKSRNMAPSFFVHGDIVVVRGIIAGIRDYDTRAFTYCGDLEVAIPLAMKEDYYDRVMDLLVARQARTAENDKREGRTTSFEYFMYWFFRELTPEKDSKSLKQFLTLKGEELNSKHPIVYEIFCQGLVGRLRWRLDDPNGKKLMVDLVGQPDVLTRTAFVKGFLDKAEDEDQFHLITYGWKEAVQEGLKEEYRYGGRDLWSVMTNKFSGQFSGPYPDTDELRAVACQHLKTKQQREEEWNRKNAEILFEKLKSLDIVLVILPKDLWTIVTGYLASLIALEDLIALPTKPSITLI